MTKISHLAGIRERVGQAYYTGPSILYAMTIPKQRWPGLVVYVLEIQVIRFVAYVSLTHE